MDQHAVWERIAQSFDRSRTRTWDHVEAFLADLPEAQRVLDLMAGNGRHTASILAAGHDAIWSDWSRPAAAIAKQRYPQAEAVVADATQLPFADASIDACIYVAGLHGIPTPEGRAASLHDLMRTLRPGGRAQITVWSRHAPRFADQGDPNQPLDVTIPWKSDGHAEDRHYHLYTLASLQDAVQDAGFSVTRAFDVGIISQRPDNLVVELQRPA